MENPLSSNEVLARSFAPSWSNETHVIGTALHSNNPGASVIAALKKTGLVQKDVPDLEALINDRIASIRDAVRNGCVGASEAMQITNLLQSLGVI